ncbi:MAG: hypothetical protein AAFV43_13865 [Planctomycetota bacterium]
MNATQERLRASRAETGGCEVTARGPNWLFVRVSRNPNAVEPASAGPNVAEPDLAEPDVAGPDVTGQDVVEQLWQISQRHFTNRLVVEIGADVPADQCKAEVDRLGRELRQLQDRLSASGGLLRLCGMRPDDAHTVLEAAHSAGLHNHATPHDAVTGEHPLDG